MKKILKSVILISVVFMMLVFFAACGFASLPEYSIAPPDGYSKSSFLSDGTSDVYDKGITDDSSDMITVTYYSEEDLKELAADGGAPESADEFAKIYFDLYFSITGAETYTAVNIGQYTLYEYKDIMDSRGALYVFCDGGEIWTVDFSVNTEEYESFKSEIPAVIDSFKVGKAETP